MSEVMRRLISHCSVLLLTTCLLAAPAAFAAEPPAVGNKAPLSATAGPAVDVSADKPVAAVPAKPAAQAQPTAAGQTPGTAKTQPAAQASGQASIKTQRAAATQAARAAGPKSNDRLDLDTTVVTGNRELPKVLYIVPWKKADIGELPAQPFNTLLDEVLTPVDRDVFRREVTYYGAISNGTAAVPNGSPVPGSQPPGTEK